MSKARVFTHRWILRHDDSKAFIILYIGLGVSLALLLGLFWLALVVGIDFLMELVKQHRVDSRPLPILTRSLWEMKLDIGLVRFGLVIGLYIDVAFGLVGLGHIARAGTQATVRVASSTRIVRGALMTLDDIALAAKGRALKNKEGQEGVLEVEMGKEREAEQEGQDNNLWGGWTAKRWALGDRITLGFVVLSILLILVAPLITDHSFSGVWNEILLDLHPFPDHGSH